MKTRIVDIARLAQVSPGTVDRVIHNRGEVSDRTREKITNIIEELNYQPDILAKSLATRKVLNLVLLMPVSANENDFWFAPLKGVDKAISEIEHYGIRIKKYFFDQFDVEAFLEESQKIVTEKPDGVLFAPVFGKESLEFVRQLKEQSTPVVLINSNLEDTSDTCFIGQDSMQSGYLAAKLLTYGLEEEGHILVLNISSRKDNYNHILLRERGFRKYFAQHFKSEYLLSTIELIQSAESVLDRKLDGEFDGNNIISVFVSNSRVFQVANYLKIRNITNVRLIGYDLLPKNVDYLNDGTIDFLISQRPEEQGYLGIITLFNKIFLNKEVKREQYIPIDIIVKENIDYYKFR